MIGFPAGKDHSCPLEGHCADRLVMGQTSVPFGFVECAGPARLTNRAVGKLDPGLVQKQRTDVTRDDAYFFAAAFVYGRDTGLGREFLRAGKAFSVCAETGGQSRFELRACPGHLRQDFGDRMNGIASGDVFIELVDRTVELKELFG